MSAHVTQVHYAGGDRITVVGTVDGHDDDAGQPIIVSAAGWVSAMEQHYDPDAYGEDGHRDPDREPRAMTDDERMAYWESLLADSVPQLPTEPTVLYQAPED